MHLASGRADRLRRVPAIPALVVLFVGLSLAGYFSLYHAGFADFRAFYCAGRVVSAGLDPYREHPLHECERGLTGRFAPTLPAGVTLPAPYPPATLLLFALIARLPFAWALAGWTAGSCAALALAIRWVAAIASAPSRAAAIVLAYPALIVPLALGQPTLYLLAAVAACAKLLQAGRPRFAAVAALATLFDPHVGLAVCLGVAAGVPRARPILLAGGAAFVALTTAAAGIGREWEYVHDVLPAHAFANLPDFGQFSTANVAFEAGAKPAVALLLGNLWYAASLVAGAVAGRRLRPRFGASAVALVPVAFAVFGGVHTHLQQLALATPAFLLLVRDARGVRRTVLLASTFIASVPWLFIAAFPYVFVATAVLGVAFARAMGARAASGVLGAATLAGLICLLAIVVRAHPPAVPFAVTIRGNPLAEVAWGAFVRASFVPPQAWIVAAKLPTIAAFGVLLSMLFAAARRRVEIAQPALPV